MKNKFTEKNLVEHSKVEVESFKELIKDMYRGFPNWQYNKMVESVIKTQKMRDELVNAKFLVREPHVFQGQQTELYMLGPNALQLVSAWETEELSKKVRKLTFWAVILASLSAVVSLASLIVSIIALSN